MSLQSGTIETVTDAGPTFLDIKSVDKIYGTRGGPITALKNVTLSVGSSQFVSLLGPSGCGKSTLLRCVAGLERPTSGRISLHGNEVVSPPTDMGMVFQR